jgi:hypothetical protein
MWRTTIRCSHDGISEYAGAPYLTRPAKYLRLSHRFCGTQIDTLYSPMNIFHDLNLLETSTYLEFVLRPFARGSRSILGTEELCYLDPTLPRLQLTWMNLESLNMSKSHRDIYLWKFYGLNGSRRRLSCCSAFNLPGAISHSYVARAVAKLRPSYHVTIHFNTFQASNILQVEKLSGGLGANCFQRASIMRQPSNSDSWKFLSRRELFALPTSSCL